MRNLFLNALQAFLQEQATRGKCQELPIVLGKEELADINKHFVQQLEQTLPWHLIDMLPPLVEQVRYGDAKYGPHPGPKRAFGALRNEFNELRTEMEAEDASIESIYKENIQVWAMAFKMLRDYTIPQFQAAQPKEPELKTSKDWLFGMNKTVQINTPSGWQLRSFFYSFNEEPITLEEFLFRLYNSSYNATKEWMDLYGPMMELAVQKKSPAAQGREFTAGA